MHGSKANIYNMGLVSDMLKDCSKYRPTCFSDIVFPITEEINQKIKQKNAILRAKARACIAERVGDLKN